MRIMNQNKQTIYFADYFGEIEVINIDGEYTGEKEISYSHIRKLRANVSAARGTADLEMFGINENYTRTVATDLMDLPITEASVFWYGYGDIPPYDESETYTENAIVLKDGKICKLIGGSWTLVPHNHVVVGIAKSLNSVTYAIKKVDVA